VGSNCDVEQKADMEIVCGKVKGGGVLATLQDGILSGRVHSKHSRHSWLRFDQLNYQGEQVAFFGTNSSGVHLKYILPIAPSMGEQAREAQFTSYIGFRCIRHEFNAFMTEPKPSRRT